MTDEQKRLVDKLMNTQHDMVVVIAQSAYAEATLLAAQREIRELREVVDSFATLASGETPTHKMDVWARSIGRINRYMVCAVDSCHVLLSRHDMPIGWWKASDCYSTREACEQATGEQS